MTQHTTTNRLAAGILSIGCMIFLFACQGDDTPTAPKAPPQAPQSGSGVTSPAMRAPDALSGRIVETMDSGGYTYVQLERNGEKLWVAMPQTTVAVGEEISLQPGMEMTNFTSTTLNRTFDKIVFSSGRMSQEGAAAAPAGMPSPGASGAGSIETPMAEVHVEKAAGPDAYTIAELHEKKMDLDRRHVTVRGKVMKVTGAVMGKNWLHLQDGSGEAGKGNHDLAVTSQDLPAVGDVVTASGTLYADRDFGAGYKYSVIVEEASVTK